MSQTNNLVISHSSSLPTIYWPRGAVDKTTFIQPNKQSFTPVQASRIQYAFDKELFTVAAKDTIKQYMTFSMSEIEEDDSDGSSADARDGSSADGSRDYGNDQVFYGALV
ncbi:Hypothetical predicted protein [Paramuricea clavata]|uniref:Uncharacterized protein n=1 Tax=Paramuricea clavata TaxID=317549 RepID=A0A7D9J1B8_PARCT|nr:Hypothetical predicted protein [Paramuricea clavata]